VASTSKEEEEEKEEEDTFLTNSSILRSVDKGLLLSLVIVLAGCVAWTDVRRACMDEPPSINTADEADEEEEEKEEETNALGLRPATKTLLLLLLLLLLPRRLLAVRTALAEAAARVLLVGWRRSILLN